MEEGFPYHAYPCDFWRYNLDDMRKIFGDFESISLKRDIEHGILLKARKPKKWKQANLDNIALYSVLLGKRTKDIVGIEKLPLARRLVLKLLTSRLHRLLLLLRSVILNILEKKYP
ncbi:MAG: hypothetical protein ACUVQY_10205 [Thermoproteota archaeon]